MINKFDLLYLVNGSYPISPYDLLKGVYRSFFAVSETCISKVCVSHQPQRTKTKIVEAGSILKTTEDRWTLPLLEVFK